MVVALVCSSVPVAVVVALAWMNVDVCCWVTGVVNFYFGCFEHDATCLR